MINQACLRQTKMNGKHRKIYLRALMPSIILSLDAAASNSNHKCPKYYTKDQDGLVQDWGNDTVYVNPPYGRAIANWVHKAYETHQQYGNTIVMLLPARTDTCWFHDYIYGQADIKFIKGRLRFSGSKCNAPFPNTIVIFQGR